MHTPPKFFFELLQLGTYPSSHGLPKHDEPSLSVLVAHMGEAQEIEGFRLAVATPFSICRRIAAKFDQACFLGMQFQVERLKSFLKFFEKLLGLISILEADHEVICKTYDHNITARLPLSPLVSPQVEHVVQVNIRQQWGNTAPLRRAFLHLGPLPILQHACVQPLFDVTNDALIRNPMLDKFQQPFVVYGIERPYDTLPTSRRRSRSESSVPTIP